MTINKYGFPTTNRKRCRPEKIEFAKKMRSRPTFPEELLWNRLSKNKTGYHFKRQAIILGWIVDFYCAQAGLIIEVDGPYHKTSEMDKRDYLRERVMWEHGFFTLRVENESVIKELDDVIAWIIKSVQKRINGEMRSGVSP